MTEDRGPELARDGRVVVLDGGMSNALEDQGHDLSGGLWTARLLRDAPDAVAAVHRAYFAAGAQVATAASYQASVPGFLAAGLDRAEAERLLGRSVGIAREVRDSLQGNLLGSDESRWVAASIGPFGAYLADGSEYCGRYGVTRARLRDFHLPRLEVLASAGPDLLAVETIPDIDEAEVIAGLLDDVGLPAWFSFSADGLRTRAGQPLRDAFAVAASAKAVFAVGVNCCHPSDVRRAVGLAAEVTGRPAVAYPNSGEEWDPRARGWRGAGSGYDVRLAAGWVEAGASYVGGCCRVGPRDIAALAPALGRRPRPAK